ncbi:MAG: HlyC/CorC family transporter [Candidatus Rokuibacteriota bacterium]|nr:MAG: HlyC/CorC family transporter [Candidatus Rokubacteria bacterium]
MLERLILQGLLLVLFLATSAFLAAAEAAYFSLSRLGTAHLEPDESPGHALLARVLRDPHDLLVTLLAGTTLVNIAASALATELATALLGPNGVAVAIPVMIFLIVVFAGILPMTVAVGAPHKIGLWAARPVLALAWLLTPVRALLGAFTAWVSRWASPNATPPASISEAELRTLVEVGHREGVVQRTEREMIHGVFELGETTVGDIMTPRTDIFGVEAGTAPERLLDEIRAHLHSRVPVYEGSLDHIVGILSTKDLLPYYAGLPADFSLRPYLAAPYFVPQTKRADALLREFKAKQLRMAIVVDEYGGTAGLVTLEDILEEVVGEIRDEFDSEERLAQRLDDRTWRVAAKMPVADFAAATGLRISDEHFDTVGGWVLDLFGRVPHRGESLDAEGVRVTVEKMHRTRILEVLVRLSEPPASRDTADRPSPAEERA